MKTTTTLVLIFFMGIYSVQSQSVCNENIVIQNQKDLDNFNCNIIDGNLTLILSEELNLESLSVLTEVRRNLYIEFVPELSPDLSGLRNLRYAQGLTVSSRGGSSWDTQIDISPLLRLDSLSSLSVSEVTLEGSFPSLKYLRHLSMYASYFRDITWLNRIDTIQTLEFNSQMNGYQNEAFLTKIPEGGELTLHVSEFSDLDGLEGIHYLKRLNMKGAYGRSLDGLSELDSTDFFLVSNTNLSGGCCGLSHYLGSDPKPIDFVFTNNSCSLEDILQGCSSICSGDVVLRYQEDFDNFACESVEGNLFIGNPEDPENNANLNTSNLKNLVRVTGSVIIIGDASGFKGLSNLQSIGSELRLESGYFGKPESNVIYLDSLKSLRSMDSFIVNGYTIRGMLTAMEEPIQKLDLTNNANIRTSEFLGSTPWIQEIRINMENYTWDTRYAFTKMTRIGNIFSYNTKMSFRGLEHLDSLNHLEIVNGSNPYGLDNLRYVDELIIKESIRAAVSCNLYPLILNSENFSLFVWEDNRYSVEEFLSKCEPNIDCGEDVYINYQYEADAFNCEVVNGSLNLLNEFGLFNLTNFQELKEVQGSFVYSCYEISNDLLKDFGNLEKIGGRLYLNGPNFDLDELSSLQFVDEITFATSIVSGSLNISTDTLRAVSISGKLEEIDWLTKVDYIKMLTTFGSRTRIEPLFAVLGNGSIFEIIIDNNEFVDLSGLNHINKMDRFLLDEVTITSFDGLENLVTVNDLYLDRVNVLGDCCGLYNLLKNGSITGELVFRNNSCTLEEILSGCAPEEVSSMSVYPNPSSTGSVTIDWEQDPSQKTHIEVLDNFGKVVRDYWLDPGNGIGKVELDISQYPSGVYLIRIITGDKVELKRLVKP